MSNNARSPTLATASSPTPSTPEKGSSSDATAFATMSSKSGRSLRSKASAIKSDSLMVATTSAKAPSAVVTPSKSTADGDALSKVASAVKRSTAVVDESSSPTAKKKKVDTFPPLSSLDFESDPGIITAYHDVYGSKSKLPTSRKEILVKVFDKYPASSVKAFFSDLCPHERKPATKNDAITKLTLYICNTFYAVQGLTDSRTSPTDRYVCTL